MSAASFEPKKIDEFIARYGHTSANLILVMQDIQAEYRFLPHEALQYLCEKLNVPLGRIYHVATFYKAFSLKPKGKHEVHVCMGTACHVRGAKLILDSVARELGIAAGETSQDMKFSLDTVNCLGSCALGPLVVVDQDYIGHATSQKMKKIIDNLKKEKED
jgi:NADH-quinone oxidoreductase subunit E